MAAQIVFNIPELAYLILREVRILSEERGDMALSCSVNRVWFLQGTSFLWEMCSLDRVMSISSDIRRELYAGQVRTLRDIWKPTQDSDDPSAKQFPDFPRLECFYVFDPTFTEWTPPAWLPSSLMFLKLEAAVITQHTLYEIIRKFPALFALTLGHVVLNGDIDSNLIPPACLKRLHHLILTSDFRQPRLEAILIFLLNLFKPVSLLSGILMNHALAASLCDADPAIADLQEIHIVGLGVAGLARLVRHMPQLKILRLSTSQRTDIELQCVHNFSMLQSLSIIFVHKKPVVSKKFLAVLPRLQLLREVLIERTYPERAAKLNLPQWSRDKMVQYLYQFAQLGKWDFKTGDDPERYQTTLVGHWRYKMRSDGVQGWEWEPAGSELPVVSL